MKLFKSHFWYNKRQRNGTFFLCIILFILQVIYVYMAFSSDKKITTTSIEIHAFQQKIDSLKTIALAVKKPKKHPFNPNYITDFKGSKLGMSLLEIDKLHAYRKQGKFVNSAIEFQKITNISDSLLSEISPYFKFPDWVLKRKKEVVKKRHTSNYSDFSAVNFSEKPVSKTEKRIVKININTASFKQILKIPYVNYQLCKKIIEYREEVAELQDISEIKNIAQFPIDKYDRIVLYLKAE
ncbi:ComEA family DNA-binding protein [Tenacibaculum dicentrarchi]|uniref:ComEA family DNA-binding protein n=1 Tax=Tenacibaculum dicentrarchi TaxID=669041 RepID=UPI000C7DC8F1|nr:conserved hypothetical protein [Tenacibaculum dicentrarchi]